MSSLTEFRDLVNSITDEKLLEVAEGLLRDLVTIQNMKEKIETLEDGLHKGDRVSFWFFTVNLNREEVDIAANTVIGRKRFLNEKAARESDDKKIMEEGSKTDSEPDDGVEEFNYS